jgi:ribosomal protein L13
MDRVENGFSRGTVAFMFFFVTMVVTKKKRPYVVTKYAVRDIVPQLKRGYEWIRKINQYENSLSAFFVENDSYSIIIKYILSFIIP